MHDAATLSTPAKEYDVSTIDTSSWHYYLCTPWSVHKDYNKFNVAKEKWSLSKPMIYSCSETYKILPRQVNDINNYKKRLQNEVGRLTIALAECNMKLKTREKLTKELQLLVTN